jgi:hypothetical protein
MILLIILLVPIGLLCLGWALDVLKNRHPLNPEEVLELARIKQWRHLLTVHTFSSIPVAADASKKKAMKASGQFVRETLENQANLRENRALIADQDWIDGWQAAWIR